MKKIYKYKIEIDDKQFIKMPEGAEVLAVGNQNDETFIWAKVETNNIPKVHTFMLYGTGHNIMDDENHKYIGTFQLNKGALIFHLFQVED